MTPEQIAAWAAAGESETLELKRTTGERRDATRTLCAMLNHRGGRVLFGVEPSGRVLGQQVSDHTIEEVAEELRAIDPPAFPTIDRVDLGNGREVLVVSVATGQNGPYSYRGQAYRRVGNTSPVLSRDEYNRMLLERLHGEHRWENEPATGWTVADLDEAEIGRTLEEAIRRGRAEDPGTRDPEEVLLGLGLVKDGKLLRAALVLLAATNASGRRFHSACCASLALSEPTRRSSSTTANSGGTPSLCCLPRSASFSTTYRLRGVCFQDAWTAWMSRSIRRWRSARRWPTPSAIATTRSAAARWESRSMTTASK